jgi:PAS domain S-box-containing protein
MSAPAPTIHERIMHEDDFIISKTDTKGKITYCNEIFMDMAAMTEDELLGQPHSIVRHPDMPKTVFKLLWEQLKDAKEIFAYVKNLSKDGSFYWVFANITPSYDENNHVIGYYSIRIKPKQSALEVIQPLYATLKEIEASSGLDSAIEHFNTLLKEKGVSYDEFVISLQA